jgi:hypothetical protein
MKVSQWTNARRKLKKQFERMGITSREMCGRTDALSFAHRMKRRYITTKEELETVALLCMDFVDRRGCHNKLEHGPREVMYERITEIINNRITEIYE